MCIWHLGTQFTGEHGSAGLIVGLDYLRDLYQSEQFYGSVILIEIGHIESLPLTL